MGRIQIFPNLLDEEQDIQCFFPSILMEVVPKINGLIAESEKAARKFLRRFISREAMDRIEIRTLSEHTKKEELISLLEPILNGETWGLISDAGLACIADPGSDLIFLANQNGVQVETFIGPCSIVLSLQLSGFSGQNFSFHGYLPRDGHDLEIKLKNLEKQSSSATQIWIEAPYRSNKMLETLKRVLNPSTFLCVAASLTMKTQSVASLSVAEWRKTSKELGKEPVIFLISTRNP